MAPEDEDERAVGVTFDPLDPRTTGVTIATEEPRASQPGEAPKPPTLTPEQWALKESENGLRQFDRMIELIDRSIGVSKLRVRPSTIMELNRIAVDGLMQSPGSYRLGPTAIRGSSHTPPNHEDVPLHIDEMCEYIEDHWASSAVHLAAYALWRLNWIHPFRDGNGRTSRSVSYWIMCARVGVRLPGKLTIPERIALNKRPYYAALDAADTAWAAGVVNVTQMEGLIGDHLGAQLADIYDKATKG